MNINDKVKVKKGLLQGKVGVIEKTFEHRGKKMFIVKVHVIAPYVEGGWDNYRTTVTEDEIEQVV